MHICIIAEVAPGSSPRPSILRSAMIIASGFFVSSTEPASASCSRVRDKASRTTIDKSQASAISTIAINSAAVGPADPLRSSLSRERRLLQSYPGVEEHAEDQLGKERNHAGNDDCDDQQPDVTVADMRELVPEYRLDLCIVEIAQESRRDRDRVLLMIEAGGEGIQCIRLHYLQLRHGDATRDAEILKKVVEARLLLACDIASAHALANGPPLVQSPDYDQPAPNCSHPPSVIFARDPVRDPRRHPTCAHRALNSSATARRPTAYWPDGRALVFSALTWLIRSATWVAPSIDIIPKI
jgi:hypothetical protein